MATTDSENIDTSKAKSAGGGVLKRYVFLLFVLMMVLSTVWLGLRGCGFTHPGDYATRQGDIRLSDHDYAGALERFETALAEFPDHRGALMGKAIALMQQGRSDVAIVAFDRLITVLIGAEQQGDETARAGLAAAYANRGILNDRSGRYRQALADYMQALDIDAKTVSGPGLLQKFLIGDSRPATVRDRARYLQQQLATAEGERVWHDSEADERQQMYKP